MQGEPDIPERDACGIGFVADAQGRPSRALVDIALAGLAGVDHRGARAADGRSADGSGVLLPIPAGLFGHGAGVAQLLWRGPDPRHMVEQAAAAEGITISGWRQPPTDDTWLGTHARRTKPGMLQAVLAPLEGGSYGTAERAAFRMRRRLAADPDARQVYVASCSWRTVVYKALVSAVDLARFYADLRDPAFTASFAVFHQRFSTNTTPSWERAQPYRMLCHNGEINALAGNEARMQARRVLGTEACGLGPEAAFHPVLHPSDSDSGKLDSALELLVRGGRDIRHAVAMLLPPAWEGDRDLDVVVRGFYQYHACLLEPWDGPAGIVFTDGLGVGAALDRNGLRPLRWAMCEDGLVVCCTEAGAVDVHGHGTVRRGRLGPGQMLFVDPSRGVLFDRDCAERIAAAGPYARWAEEGLLPRSAGEPVLEPPDPDELGRRQAAHGWTVEEQRMMLRPMAVDAKEPTFAMGDDTALPPLADRPRPVAHFLRQRFAQVTNPPIDHLRERAVMSLRTLIGPRQPLLTERPEAAQLVELDSFLVFPSRVESLVDAGPFPAAQLDATFPVGDGPDGLRAGVARLVQAGLTALENGAGVLVVDNGAVRGTRAPIPSLLAVGALHHALVDRGRRLEAAVIAVADDARDVHGVAALLGCGADAVCARLALETVAADADASEDSDVSSPDAQERWQAAVEDGVLKVMSKMGISTVESYRWAQIFEVVGLAPEVVECCFTGMPSPVGGLGWAELGADVLAWHVAAGWGGPPPALPNPGWYRDLKRGGDYHLHDKAVVHAMQQAIASRRDADYEAYAALVSSRPSSQLRDLLALVPAGPPVPLSEVEPASSIVARFSTGAMSHGSLSAEAHETLAEAMNLIGGRSNCGEGGENPLRFRTRGAARGDKNSRIKQIASGRFGVTPEYCAFADELQIKMAQGSKPGEGGQLPGHKVSDEIARLRHTQPGVTLISPPPHHDIYSIEDLAQLIYDLKQVNSSADVSVKLVAEEGVGTVAAGVVKAQADVVHISGADGGTGASPLSSIKHAGMPWELGLAETQAALVENGLRSRVRLRVDGGFLTGQDVLVAALLGADEYSFGTAAMIAEGCIMLRACHKDTCTTGIATQRPNLRAKFGGTPEGVAAYFWFVAEEVRRLLAGLGFRRLDDAIGRAGSLARKSTGDARSDLVDLSRLLGAVPADGSNGEGDRHFVAPVGLQRQRSSLGDQLLSDVYRLLWDGDVVERAYAIGNADRAVGAALSGALALEFGEDGPPGRARLRFDGEAGQSFGAFLSAGIQLHLVGEANDYVGKGMGGGRVVIRPPADDAGDPVLAGNTCLYGATGGELFVAGSAGERFGVRNSGAHAVVEGVGDHLCEYMTGGTVAVLGPVGRNIGAGMTGGLVFVWDPPGRLPGRINPGLVEARRPSEEEMDELRWLIEQHARATGSRRAEGLLDAWGVTTADIWAVAPLGRVRRGETQDARRVSASV